MSLTYFIDRCWAGLFLIIEKLYLYKGQMYQCSVELQSLVRLEYVNTKVIHNRKLNSKTQSLISFKKIKNSR